MDFLWGVLLGDVGGDVREVEVPVSDDARDSKLLEESKTKERGACWVSEIKQFEISWNLKCCYSNIAIFTVCYW